MYTYDENGHVDLLVPNIGLACENRDYITVGFDQTASHMYHAEELGIRLPKNWDMLKYLDMDRVDRINYTMQMVGPETVTKVQNKIGKSISLIFGGLGNTHSVVGKARMK